VTWSAPRLVSLSLIAVAVVGVTAGFTVGAARRPGLTVALFGAIALILTGNLILGARTWWREQSAAR
jgi:hypothetical protein